MAIPPNTDSNRHPSGGVIPPYHVSIPQFIRDEQAESQLILIYRFTSQVTGWKPVRNMTYSASTLLTASLVLTICD